MLVTDVWAVFDFLATSPESCHHLHRDQTDTCILLPPSALTANPRKWDSKTEHVAQWTCMIIYVHCATEGNQESGLYWSLNILKWLNVKIDKKKDFFGNASNMLQNSPCCFPTTVPTGSCWALHKTKKHLFTDGEEIQNFKRWKAQHLLKECTSPDIFYWRVYTVLTLCWEMMVM